MAPEPPQRKPREDSESWRNEVSQKVKAYGERKKILTTPPKPLKDSTPAEPFQEPVRKPEPEVRQPPPAPARPAVNVRPNLDPPPPPVAPPVQKPTFAETVRSGAPPMPSLDIHNDDLLEEEPPRVALPETAAAPRYIGRRAISFVIDNIILIVLHAALVYACSIIISYDFLTLVRETWIPLIGVFLLFHCIYYTYFYKTSRQTPGQVFYKLELRDPNSGAIPLRKVLVRWLCMIVLNVFNLIPALTGKGPLLLDRISGTEIRQLRNA